MREAGLDALRRRLTGSQWPTIALVLFCHLAWYALVFQTPRDGALPATVALAIVLTLYASLQHEILHGHPFRSARLNALLVWPAYGLFIPFRRFRTLHLAHHRDERLTDPYDDPESNYLDPHLWHRLPRPIQWLLMVNNTLAGRMLIGPMLGLSRLYAGDVRRVVDGDRQCAREWLAHIPPLLLIVYLVTGPTSITPGAYALAAYASLGILRIRTFLEHRAHRQSAYRTVVIDSRGPLAFLFLYNNFHAVHHAHPRMPWYRLPGYFHRHRHAVLARNGGYRYANYLAVMCRYLWRPKDPVPHPLGKTLGSGSATPCSRRSPTGAVVWTIDPAWHALPQRVLCARRHQRHCRTPANGLRFCKLGRAGTERVVGTELDR